MVPGNIEVNGWRLDDRWRQLGNLVIYFFVLNMLVCAMVCSNAIKKPACLISSISPKFWLCTCFWKEIFTVKLATTVGGGAGAICSFRSNFHGISLLHRFGGFEVFLLSEQTPVLVTLFAYLFFFAMFQCRNCSK